MKKELHQNRLKQAMFILMTTLLLCCLFSAALAEPTYTIPVVFTWEPEDLYTLGYDVYLDLYRDGELYKTLQINQNTAPEKRTFSTALRNGKTGENYEFDLKIRTDPKLKATAVLDKDNLQWNVHFERIKSGPVTLRVRLEDNNDAFGLRPETIAPRLAAKRGYYDEEALYVSEPADHVVRNEDGTFTVTWNNVQFHYPDLDDDVDVDTYKDWQAKWFIQLGDENYVAECNTYSYSLSDYSPTTVQMLLDGPNYWADIQLYNYLAYNDLLSDEYKETPTEINVELVDKDGNAVEGTRRTVTLEHTVKTGTDYANYMYASGSVLWQLEEGEKDYRLHVIDQLPPYWRLSVSRGSTQYGVRKFTADAYTNSWNPYVVFYHYDNGNALGLRPKNVTLKVDIGQDIHFQKKVTINGSTVFYYLSNNNKRQYFPMVAADGTPMTINLEVEGYPGHYSVVPSHTPTAESSYIGKVEATLTTRTLTAEVKWDKERNDGRNRPNDVILTVKDQNGKIVGSKFASPNTGWKASFDVPVYDENGDIASYTIEQNDLQLYTTKITRTLIDGGNPPTEEGAPETALDDVEHFVITNTEQEDWNYAIDLVWDTEIIDERYDRYEVSQSSNYERALTYKLTIYVNAAMYKKGDLEVRLPYYLDGYGNRNGTITAVSAPRAQEIAVPMYPDYNPDNAFHYYVDDHGTDDKRDDELVFVNWRDIEDSINQTIEVKHRVYPSYMLDTIPQTWQAVGYGTKFEVINGEVVKKEVEVQKSPVISYGVDTGCYLPKANIHAYPIYRKVDGFSTPYDPEKYVYFEIWNGQRQGQYERLTLNQYLTYTAELEASEGIEISKNYFYWTGSTESGLLTVNPDDPSKAVYQASRTPSTSSSHYSIENRGYIIRIPRDKIGQEDESYTGTIKFTHSARVDQQHENDKVSGLDYNDYWTSSSEITFTWEPQESWSFDGDIYTWSKYGGSLPSAPVTRLQLGLDLKVSNYYVTGKVYGYDMNPFQLDIRDDALYVVGSIDGTKTEPVRLEAGDYEMNMDRVYVYWHDKDDRGNTTYTNVPKGDFIIMGQKTVDGPWEEIERFKVPSDRYSYYEYRARSAKYSGKGYTSLRIISPQEEEDNMGYLSVEMHLYPKLFANRPVFQSLVQQGIDMIYLHNWAAFKLYEDDGTGNYQWINSYDYLYTPSSNRANLADWTDLIPKDFSREGAYMARAHTYTYGGEVTHGSGVSKTLKSAVNNTIDGTVDAVFTLSATENMTGVSSDVLATDVYKAYVADMSWQHGMFYDLLPLGYYYDSKVTPTVSGYNNDFPARVVKVETVDNYKNSNRQMVKFHLKFDGEPGKNIYTYSSSTYTGFNLTFQAKASWDDLSLFPYGYNVMGFQKGSENAEGTIVFGGEANQIPGSREDNGGLFTSTHGTDVRETMTDLNGDGISSGIKDTLMASAYINPDFVSAYQIGLAKFVKANSGIWQTHDFADLGGEYYYKIRLTMGSGGTTRNLVLFDVLEDAVNTQAATQEAHWKGTFKSFNVRVPELQGIAPKVYYSTVKNLDSNKFTGINDLQNEEVWSLTPPEDLSTVTALAFDLSKKPSGSDYVFDRAMTTEMEITMVAPEELPPAELAYNRSSYAALFKANGSAESTEEHNIGHRVTVALRDEKDLFFTKLGIQEGADPAGLPGAEFTLYKCEHEHTLICSDDCHTHTGKPGEEGSCWISTPFQTAESDANGLVSFTDLPTGYFAFVESRTVNGYEPLTDMWWTFEVQATSDGFITEPVNAGTAENHVSMNKDTDGSLSLLNTRIKTSIPMEKRWAGEDADLSIRPASIVLDLYRNEQPYIEGVTLTPDASGNWQYTFTDLYVADFLGVNYQYEVRERPVPGYSCNGTEENGVAILTNTCLGQLEISKKVFHGDQNKPFTFVVAFSGTGTPLEGDYQVFKTAADGSVSMQTVTAADSSLTVTAAHGESVRLVGLPIGSSYTVTEQPAAGYTPAVTAGVATGIVEAATVHTVTITNTYDASGEWNPVAAKWVNGEPAEADEIFTFQLTSGANVPKVSQKKENAGSLITFDAVEYGLSDIGKTYSYTVKECATDKPGYSIDQRVYDVCVTITDNGDGILTATPTYSLNGAAVDQIVFDNTYEAKGQLILEGIKTVNGHKPRENQVFRFELTGQGNGVPQTAVNEGSSILFDAITYDLSDLANSPFTYNVKEVSVSENGYMVDDHVYTVCVWLADNGDGTLKVTKQILTGGQTADSVQFNNTYHASGELILTAAKTVNGLTPRADQVYSFQLTSEEGTPAVSQQKSNTLGAVIFDPLTYTYEDVDKTYTYTVSETTASQGDLVADPTVYTVRVKITDNGDGTMLATPAFFKGEEAAQAIVFDNTLYAPLTIQKTVDGPATEETFPIKIWLYDENQVEVKDTFHYTGDLTGQLVSGDTILLGHGQSITIVDLIPGMRYTVEEKPGVRYTATVNGQGQETVSGQCTEGGNTVSFVNVIKTTGLSVTKQWDGAHGGTIQLTLYANGIKLENQPVPHQDGDTYSYTNLPKYDLNGDEIRYTVKEKYMDGYLAIYDNIAPHESESDCVYNGGKIINREVVVFRIRKVWSGIKPQDAPPIRLTLYCNGTVYKKEQPEPDANGLYVYTNLPKYVGGVPAVYTVKEAPMGGYDTHYYASDGQETEMGVNGGQILNIKIPDTRDKQPVQLWFALMAMAGIVLAVMVIRMNRRCKD